MKNKIDYKKLELCMVELFGDSKWDMYDEKSRRNIQFLTSGGQIVNEKFVGNGYIDEIDNNIKLPIEERGHTGCLTWAAALYISKYIPESDKVGVQLCNLQKDTGHGGWHCSIINNKLKPVNGEWDWNSTFDSGEIRDNFIKETKICRVVMRDGDLNIESHNPLSSGQRKFFLEVIEGLDISPDEIFIDDWTEEQCIKRQLGLHFFK